MITGRQPLKGRPARLVRGNCYLISFCRFCKTLSERRLSASSNRNPQGPAARRNGRQIGLGSVVQLTTEQLACECRWPGKVQRALLKARGMFGGGPVSPPEGRFGNETMAFLGQGRLSTY